MGEDGVKLYANKPKKAQLKQFQEQQKAAPSSTPAAPTASSTASAAASYKMGSQSTASAPPPPPQPPKESFARRYKFLWPLLLTVNLGVGAYLFMRTKKKDTGSEEEAAASNLSSTPAPSSNLTSLVAQQPISVPAIAEAVKPREPLAEDQQRELFKWMLEEKRKIKPKNAEEKKRIDEEKAILKQIIRTKSIPTI